MKGYLSWMAGAVGLAAAAVLAPMPATAQQKIVGVTFPDFVASFWISAAYGIEDEAQKAGVKVVKLSAGGDANVSQQIAQIQDLIQRKVDAIIVGSTNDEALKGVVQQAIDRGIIMIGLASIADSPRVTSIVTGDHYDMGRLQARCLAKAVDGKGDVAMMAGPAGQYWADQRALGFKETLAKESPAIKVVAESRLADNRNAALTTAEDWVQRFPTLKGIYAATDDIAAGVITAYKSSGKLKDVKVSASNFGPTGQELLKQGDLVCTSIQPIVSEGRAAFQQAFAAMNKKPVEKRVQLPAILVTQDNFSTIDLSAMAAPSSYKP